MSSKILQPGPISCWSPGAGCGRAPQPPAQLLAVPARGSGLGTVPTQRRGGPTRLPVSRTAGTARAGACPLRR